MARIFDCDNITPYVATVTSIYNGRAIIHVNELERNVLVDSDELRKLGKDRVGECVAYVVVTKGNKKYRFLGIYKDDSNMSQKSNELS